jgi:hypothetical protein
MTYASGPQNYFTPDDATDWYPLPTNQSSPHRDKVGRSLGAVVFLLGAAVFAVNSGTSPGPLFAVPLAVAAAVVAGIGQLPHQTGRDWIVVALAVTGFFDATGAWLAVDAPSWNLTTTTVLGAVQSVSALCALIHWVRQVAAAKFDDDGAYSAYLRAVEEYQNYAMQLAGREHDTATGQASAQAHATAPVSAQPGAVARESYEALQARYAQYGLNGPQDRPQDLSGAPASPTADPGVPGTNYSAPTQRIRRAHPVNDQAPTAYPSSDH